MEALGTLAGGIAHDFNNLLTAIGSNTDLALTEASVTPPVKEHLAELRKAHARATDLVKRILLFSRRQESDRKPIAPGPGGRRGRQASAREPPGDDRYSVFHGAGPARGACGRVADSPGDHEPRHQCGARDGRRGRRASDQSRLAPARMSASVSAIPARGSVRRFARACSSRSSPQRARPVPASDCPSLTAS